MQNDIGSLVARNLNGDNEQVRQLIEVIKTQLEEIKKRGDKIMDLEDKNDMLQKNLTILATANKQLESMIETLRAERLKLVEEIETLKDPEEQKTATPTVQKTNKRKKVKSEPETKQLV